MIPKGCSSRNGLKAEGACDPDSALIITEYRGRASGCAPGRSWVCINGCICPSSLTSAVVTVSGFLAGIRGEGETSDPTEGMMRVAKRLPVREPPACRSYKSIDGSLPFNEPILLVDVGFFTLSCVIFSKATRYGSYA